MRISSLISLLLILAGISSCMKDKPEDFPDKVIWDPELAFPIGMEQYGMNAESGFDTTKFEEDPSTGLPLWVNEVAVLMEGSIYFDLSNLDSHIDSVDWIMFRLGIYNGFPNEVMTQAYFLDASSSVLDSMFSEGPLAVPAGTPISGGESIDPSYTRNDAMFNRERLASLENTREILFRALFLNQDIDTNLVPYYPNYEIDVEIGMMTKLTIEY